jgi:hypothetical protein
VKEEYRSSGVQRGCYVETVLISRRQSLFCSSGEGRTAAGWVTTRVGEICREW